MIVARRLSRDRIPQAVAERIVSRDFGSFHDERARRIRVRAARIDNAGRGAGARRENSRRSLRLLILSCTDRRSVVKGEGAPASSADRLPVQGPDRGHRGLLASPNRSLVQDSPRRILVMADTDREYRKAFYRALNVHQGASMLSEEEEFERYYVPIYDQPDGPVGPDLVKEMATAIDFTTGGSVQLLAGYRGAGKTTELMRLCRVLDRDAYVPVYWDIEDYFNTELPLKEWEFLIGLAAGFVDNCEGAGIPKEKLIDRIRTFFNRIEVDSSAVLDASAGPASFNIKAALQDDTSFRNQVKKALSSNRRRFKEEIHAFFDAMVDAMPGGKTPVFIVDSIDHYRGRTKTFDEVRESVESLFSVYSSELALPRMHVIYTVPVYVKPIGWGGQIWPVLNVKVRERDGSDCREGIDLLRRVLARRAPDGDPERLLGDQVDRVIRASGGLFRDLFHLVSALLLKDSGLPVSVTEIDGVERQQRSYIATGLSEEQWEILATVKKTQKFRVPREHMAEAWALQALGYVLCYRNGEVDWFGVHPLLGPLVAKSD
jgi:hypothetical protein